MAERDVERYLKRRVEESGGVYEKHKAPGQSNVPDDICSWQFGFKDWVECKDRDEVPRPGQIRDHRRRRAMGHMVWVVDNEAAVDRYVEFCVERQGRALRGILIG